MTQLFCHAEDADALQSLSANPSDILKVERKHFQNMPLVDDLHHACFAKRDGRLYDRTGRNMSNTEVARQGHNTLEKSIFDSHKSGSYLPCAKPIIQFPPAP